MRRAIAVAAVAFVALIATAAPASAHGVGGREPTNTRVRILEVDPSVEGVHVDLVDFSTKVEVATTAGAEVVVLGYQGEPYLRIDGDGVFENVRSPASFLNQTLDPQGDIPDEYDADAEPEWEKLSDGNSVSWHDHRAHWMLPGTPPEPQSWEIDLLVDGEPMVVRGDLSTVEAPPWWPWLLSVGVIATAIVLLARRWWRPTMIVGLGGVLAAEVAHVAGAWREIASTTDDRLAAHSLSVLAFVAGALALAQVVRRDPYRSAPWVVLASVVFGVVAAGDVLTWTHSQIPSVFAPAGVRALVAVTFGAALGLAVGAWPRLRTRRPAEPAAA